MLFKKFELNKEDDVFLKISLGKQSLQASKDLIKFETFSFQEGKVNTHIPMHAVTAIETGWKKQFIYIAIALIISLGSVFYDLINNKGHSNADHTILIIGLIIAAIYVILYLFNQTMFFDIYNGGDNPIVEFKFKKSISIEKINEAADALDEAVLNSRK